MRPKIFLSRAATLSGLQEETFDAWSAHLVELEFQVDRLRRNRYSDVPWDKLRQILAQVDGVVAFGFSQATVDVEGQQGELSRSMRASPWIHIEAAMAIQAATPVLAVPESGITEGVFESAIWSGYLYGIPAGTKPSRNAVPESWIAAVHLASRERSLG